MKVVPKWKYRGVSFSELGQEQLNQTAAWLDEAARLREELRQIAAHDAKVRQTNCEVQWKSWHFHVYEPVAQAVAEHTMFLDSSNIRWQRLKHYELFLDKAQKDPCTLYLDQHCKETYDPSSLRDYPPFSRVTVPPTFGNDPMNTYQWKRHTEKHLWADFPRLRRRTTEEDTSAFLNPFKFCRSTRAYFLPFYTKSSNPSEKASQNTIFCPSRFS